MDITMASIHLIGFINLLLLINPATAAMAYGYIGPTSTTVGSVGIQIMAPRPTRPPSIDENIGELRKRRLPDSIYSRIPASWCGFVNGDFNSPLSCETSTDTCVVISSYLYTSLACSPYDNGRTPIIYRSCLNSIAYALLPTAKSVDTTVCSRSSSPYCHFATLALGEYYIFCDSTKQSSTLSIEYLGDWFSTGIISALLTQSSSSSKPSKTDNPSVFTIPAQYSTTSAIDSSSGGGLAAPTIAGIGVAVGAVVVGAFAGIVICFYMRRRKRKERASQPGEISTSSSNPPMQQTNQGPGMQTIAPASSPYPNSQTAFLKNPEQPSPPYSSEPSSIHNPHSPSLSSPVMPYDSTGRTGSTGLYPLSQNPSTTPSLVPSVYKPGELSRFGNSSDHTAQPISLPISLISGVGRNGGETRVGSPTDNRAHEMATGFSLQDNPRGSCTSQIPTYQEISSSVVSPIRGGSGTQSPPPLHPVHEAPQVYYEENQAHGIVSPLTSRQSDLGANYEGTHRPRELAAGGGGGGSHSDSISGNTGHPSHDIAPPTPVAAAAAPNFVINGGAYEGQQAHYSIHEAPTTHTVHSPGTSPVSGAQNVYP